MYVKCPYCDHGICGGVVTKPKRCPMCNGEGELTEREKDRIRRERYNWSGKPQR